MQKRDISIKAILSQSSSSVPKVIDGWKKVTSKHQCCYLPWKRQCIYGYTERHLNSTRAVKSSAFLTAQASTSLTMSSLTNKMIASIERFHNALQPLPTALDCWSDGSSRLPRTAPIGFDCVATWQCPGYVLLFALPLQQQEINGEISHHLVSHWGGFVVITDISSMFWHS